MLIVESFSASSSRYQETQATTVRAKNRERSLAPLSPGEEAARRGITLEVLDGPMDGSVLTGTFDRITIGRNPGNDLELHSDRSVSGDHAILRRTEDGTGWLLEEIRSTNGTWVDGRRLNAGEVVPLTGDFMTGHTVIRLSAGAAAESFLPDAEHLRDETARLAVRFATETAEGYGAAVALAAGELKPSLGDRHFFLGLVTMNPGLGILARNHGPVPPRFLSETLRRNEYWSGSQAWISRQLRALAIEVGSLFKDDLTPTPRLLRLLLAAEEAARQASAPLIRPEDVLQAFFAGPANRPRDLLARDGIEAESLLPLLGQAAAGRQAAASAPPPAAAEPVRVSSGEPGLDARAQEMARGLYGVAALYQLAAAEDRRDAMRQFLVQEIAQVTGEGRPRLLRQVQRLFPVAAGPPAVELAVAASQERSGKRKKAALMEAPPAPPASGVPWRAVLEGGGREEALAGLAAEDRAAAELFTDLYSFSTNLEQFIVTVVQELRSPGTGTQTLQLPGARTSISRHARDLAAGKSPRRETLKEYLSAIETWLVAAVAAYHEGPDLWFKEFWHKVSPAAIESRLADENKKKRLSFGIDALEFWNRYKERVRTVSPDLVSDEILHIVRRRVDEQYNQLYERRKP
ncbi:MAG TPA: FHA domain-containing protein [Thermoanaerobaculia bacterium]|nr:FHA domain-containing protein [Thermoanaerobaculia bacterium]